MSTASINPTSTTLGTWATQDDLHSTGFRPAGPEIDYGMLWGENQTIRLSYAPLDRDHGYLYAHDRATGAYSVLVADTTPDAVEQAVELLADTSLPGGHLALAAVVDNRPLLPDHAHSLWRHCLDREVDARRAYLTASAEDRVPAARTVIINENARISAEDLLVNAYAAGAGADPIVVRYRIPEWPGWVGRFASPDIDGAMRDARTLLDISRSRDFTIRATSVGQGHTIVAASRVPALDFIASRHTLEPGIEPAF